MKLYGTPPTRALRPIWLLNELGLDCEIVPINLVAGEHREAEFRALNPSGKVPLLVDGDLRIAESAAISLYLADRYGEGRFIPADVSGRGRMFQWVFFLVTEIEQPLWRVALHTAFYAEHDRRSEEIELARRDCRQMLGVLDAHMSEVEWIAGSEITVADFIAAFTLDWADEQDLLHAFPNLQRFLERMYTREKAPPTIGESFAALGQGRVAGRYRQSA